MMMACQCLICYKNLCIHIMPPLANSAQEKSLKVGKILYVTLCEAHGKKPSLLIMTTHFVV